MISRYNHIDRVVLKFQIRGKFGENPSQPPLPYGALLLSRVSRHASSVSIFWKLLGQKSAAGSSLKGAVFAVLLRTDLWHFLRMKQRCYFFALSANEAEVLLFALPSEESD